MALITEMTPPEQAKALGMVYLGFGGYGYEDDRLVRARTIDGKLVRVEDEEEVEEEKDLGKLVIFDFDDELLYTDLKKNIEKVKGVIYLIKSLIKTGSDTIIMHSRNSEKLVAKFLEQVGVTVGPTLVPYGSSTPEKKKKFVAKKIKAGYKEIYFFDRDVKALHAIESLKAPYNKLDVEIETHQIPRLEFDPESRKAPKSVEQI